MKHIAATIGCLIASSAVAMNPAVYCRDRPVPDGLLTCTLTYLYAEECAKRMADHPSVVKDILFALADDGDDPSISDLEILKLCSE